MASITYVSAKPMKASLEAHRSNPISPTSSLKFLVTDPSNHIHQPPPLNKRRLVPLPALAKGPILIHPLLAYSPSHPSIQFEIGSSFSSITLSPDANQEGWRLWKRHAAMDPPNIGSLTIIMTGVSRPIIVFPATMDDSVVTIEDVLMAVHRSALVAVHDHPLWTSRCDLRLRHQRPTASPSANGEGCFHSNLWWTGLYPSPDERDVWILHTKNSSGNLLLNNA